MLPRKENITPLQSSESASGIVSDFSQLTSTETDRRLEQLMKQLLAAPSKTTPDDDPTLSSVATVVKRPGTETEKKEENLPEELKPISLDKNRLLNEACRRGKVEIVKELVSLGADINNRSVDGLTPVMIAAWTGDKDLLDLLMKEQCDPSVNLDNGNNILHVACFGGNVDIVDFIVTNNAADIDSKGVHERTAVMKAAQFGLKEVFDLLVAKGSDLTGVDDTDMTILHLACFNDDVEIVRCLLDWEIVGTESRGQYGRTPVMLAAQKGNKKVFDLLVNRGCSLSVVDERGSNLLHLACYSNNTEIVSYLISHVIADIECKGQLNRTPVMFAAEKSQKAFDFLVSKGCDLSGVDDDGWNTLHFACIGGNVDTVRCLLECGAVGIDSRGQYGRTAVMFAAEAGHKDVFDLLVSRGCDLRVVDNYGNNILHLASFNDNVEIAQYLISKSIADLDGRGDYGRTPLMFAAETGHKKVFDLLLRAGSDLRAKDHDENTLLHLAAFSDNVEIVDYVLSQNIAGINSRGENGRTPAMLAAEIGRSNVFDVLVSKGSDLSVVDAMGNNMLHEAAIGGNVGIVQRVLRNTDIDIRSRSNNGRTAAEKALRFKHMAVARLLKARGGENA